MLKIGIAGCGNWSNIVLNEVENNENLKSNITALKNTEAFKELEDYVAEFSGA